MADPAYGRECMDVYMCMCMCVHVCVHLCADTCTHRLYDLPMAKSGKKKEVELYSVPLAQAGTHTSHLTPHTSHLTPHTSPHHMHADWSGAPAKELSSLNDVADAKVKLGGPLQQAVLTECMHFRLSPFYYSCNRARFVFHVVLPRL